MTNAEIAAAFDELAVLYELDGAVKYRVLAYSTAAKAIRESPVSIARSSPPPAGRPRSPASARPSPKKSTCSWRPARSPPR
jgi:hypothetical protein